MQKLKELVTKEKLKKAAFWGGLLGGVKLVANAFGVEITDEMVNDLANGLAALFITIGVILDHGKTQPSK